MTDGATAVREVRAVFDDDSITVYQAYAPAVARPALAVGTFVPPFKRDRMTWIKPSFLWMMYRCGWGRKRDQEVVLAVRIRRRGFEDALRCAVLSHFDPVVYADEAAWRSEVRASPVRVQWDPERDLHLQPQQRRSLQVGLSGTAVGRYVEEWILGISDVTDLAQRVEALVRTGDVSAAREVLPPERPYPLPPDVATRIAATPQG